MERHLTSFANCKAFLEASNDVEQDACVNASTELQRHEDMSSDAVCIHLPRDKYLECCRCACFDKDRSITYSDRGLHLYEELRSLAARSGACA